MCPPSQEKKWHLERFMLTLYQVGSYHYQTMDNDATGNKSDTKHKCQLRKHICAPKFEVKKMFDNSNRSSPVSKHKFESNGGFTFSDTVC